MDRPEPFRLALGRLRDQLQAGAFAPGARVTASEVAAELRLSPTPVREALSRLAGEGLLEEHRGQGFYVPRLGGGDLADLYRLGLAHLRLALDPQRPTFGPAPGEPQELDLDGADEAALAALEDRVLARWVADAGGPLLLASYRRIQMQLGRARRLEARVIAGVREEAAALVALAADGDRARRILWVQAFHEVRIGAADVLASLLEAESAWSRLPPAG